VVQFSADTCGQATLTFRGAVEQLDTIDAGLRGDTMWERANVVRLHIGRGGGRLTHENGEQQYIEPGAYLVTSDGLFPQIAPS